MASNSSFLPEDYLEKRIARRTNAICLTLFVVVMIGVVAAWFVTGRQYQEVRKQRAAVKSELADKAKMLDKVEELTKQRETMKQKARVTSALVEKVPRDRMLAELINHMPPTMGLLKVGLKTEAVKSTARPATSMEREKTSRRDKAVRADEPAEVQIQPTVVGLSIVGLAPTDVEVAAFMQAVSSHELFSDVNLKFSEQTLVLEQPVRRFSIDMTINQDVDLSQVEKTLVARDLKHNPMSDQVTIDGSALVRPAADRPQQ